MSKYILDRPICFIDLETTGVHIEQDRIVEISVLKLNKDWKGKVVKTMLINPGIPIPKAASDIHGITDEMVKDKPTFAQISKSLLSLIGNCDIAGYHSNRFDIPFLDTNFHRVGLVWDWKGVNLIDVGNLFKIKEPRTLSAAVKFYCRKEHSEAHSAEADITATHEVFIKQLQQYDDLPGNMKDLALFSNYGIEIVDLAGKFRRGGDGFIYFNFGSHIGKLAKSEINYLSWMIDKGDFTQDTKRIAREILNS